MFIMEIWVKKSIKNSYLSIVGMTLSLSWNLGLFVCCGSFVLT